MYMDVLSMALKGVHAESRLAPWLRVVCGKTTKVVMTTRVQLSLIGFSYDLDDVTTCCALGDTSAVEPQWLQLWSGRRKAR